MEDKIKKVEDRLLKEGFSSGEIAGILGMLLGETKDLNPKQHQIRKDGSRGKGFGIGQWEKSGRLEQLKKYAKETGKDLESLDTQLDFLVMEMKANADDYKKLNLDPRYKQNHYWKKAEKSYKDAPTPENVAIAGTRYFERPATSIWEKGDSKLGNLDRKKTPITEEEYNRAKKARNILGKLETVKKARGEHLYGSKKALKILEDFRNPNLEKYSQKPLISNDYEDGGIAQTVDMLNYLTDPMNSQDYDYQMPLRDRTLPSELPKQELTPAPSAPERKITNKGSESKSLDEKSKKDLVLEALKKQGKTDNTDEDTKPSLEKLYDEYQRLQGRYEKEIDDNRMADAIVNSLGTLNRLFETGQDFKSNLGAQAERDRSRRLSETIIKSNLLGFGTSQQSANPDSRESKIARELAKKQLKAHGLKYEDYYTAESSAKDVRSTLTTIIGAKVKRDRQEETGKRQDKNIAYKEAEQLENRIDKLDSKLKKRGLFELNRQLQDMDRYLKNLGSGLNDSDPMPKDIPGQGMLGTWRPMFTMGEDDQQFELNIRSMANRLLKERSGAAVTNQEYRRLLKELGKGDLDNETSMVKALRLMKKDIENITRSTIKSYPKEVGDTYIKRTGLDYLNQKKSSLDDMSEEEANEAIDNMSIEELKKEGLYDE